MSDSIGHQLKEAREARGLVIEDVAHKTRVHHDVLRQLEADDYEQIPNLMFVKSFLKIYGEYVDIDPSEAIAQLDSAADGNQQYLLGGVDPSIRNRYGHLASRIPVRPILASAAVVIAIGLGGSYLVSQLYGSDPAAVTSDDSTPPAESSETPGDPQPPTGSGMVETESEDSRPVPGVPSDLTIPENLDEIDPKEILKATPVVRKAEQVEESEEAEEQTDGSNPVSSIFVREEE